MPNFVKAIKSLCCPSTGGANRSKPVFEILEDIHNFKKSNDETHPISVNSEWLKQLPDVPANATQSFLVQDIGHKFYDYCVGVGDLNDRQVREAASLANLSDRVQKKFDQITGNDMEDEVKQQLYANPPNLHEMTLPQILAFWAMASSTNVRTSNRRDSDDFVVTLKDIPFPLGKDFSTYETQPNSHADTDYYLRILLQYPKFIVAHWIWSKLKALKEGVLRFASPKFGTAISGYHIYRLTDTHNVSFASMVMITQNRLTGLVASIVAKCPYFDVITDESITYQYEDNDGGVVTMNFGFGWIRRSHYCHKQCDKCEKFVDGVKANMCEALFHGVLGDVWLNNSVSIIPTYVFTNFAQFLTTSSHYSYTRNANANMSSWLIMNDSSTRIASATSTRETQARNSVHSQYSTILRAETQSLLERNLAK